METKKGVTPFIKWAGGKTQLLDILTSIIPKNYDRFIEPFIGGGAVFLNLKPDNGIINDANKELITTWKTIKNNLPKLLIKLNKYVEEHNQNPKEHFLKIRELNVEDLSDIEIAARFIYLNKTCFNGLYRVNKSNKFNVPFGKKEIITKKTLYSKENLSRISLFLNNRHIEINNLDYKEILGIAKKGDFIFVDPPYDSDLEVFDSYTASPFGKEGQIELFNILDELTKKGVKWILTNHNTKLINELYSSKYKKFNIPVNRFINSDFTKRLNATFETIFYNYELTDQQLLAVKKQQFLRELKRTSFYINEYVSWDSIISRIENIELELTWLNTLFVDDLDVLKKRIKVIFDIENIREKVFKLLPLLLAKRLEKEEQFYYISKGQTKKFDPNDFEIILDFIIESRLANKLFLKSSINDMKSYILGLEVGLTSNDKKNKSGNYLPIIIENLLENQGITFQKEVSYEEVLQIKLTKNKKFDFVFEYKGKKYCLETNFFNSSGSKIVPEMERFLELNQEFKRYKDITFIYVSDGQGLKKHSNHVFKMIDEMEHFYNIFRFEIFLKNL